MDELFVQASDLVFYAVFDFCESIRPSVPETLGFNKAIHILCAQGGDHGDLLPQLVLVADELFEAFGALDRVTPSSSFRQSTNAEPSSRAFGDSTSSIFSDKGHDGITPFS